MTIPAPSEHEGGPVLRSSSILDKKFSGTRFREGYSTVGVDDFLSTARSVIATYEREGATATGIAVTGDDVVNVRFKPTSLRAGYDQDEVDEYLDLIVATLRHYEGAVAAG